MPFGFFLGFSGVRSGEVRPRLVPRMRRAQPRFRAHHFQPHFPHQPLHVLLLTVRPTRRANALPLRDNQVADVRTSH